MSLINPTLQGRSSRFLFFCVFFPLWILMSYLLWFRLVMCFAVGFFPLKFMQILGVGGCANFLFLYCSATVLFTQTFLIVLEFFFRWQTDWQTNCIRNLMLLAKNELIIRHIWHRVYSRCKQACVSSSRFGLFFHDKSSFKWPHSY